MRSTRVALVTGASSGIGAAFADELARRGFDLVLVARRADRLDAKIRSFPEERRRGSSGLSADLSNEEDVERVSERLATGVDLLVNNAGLGFGGRFAEESDENIRTICRVNLEVVARLARAALPSMIGAGQGAIVNVASMSSFQPVPHLAMYAATKAAVLSLTEALADELEGTGVSVQALCPGNIPTEFQERAGTRGTAFDGTPTMSAADVVRASLDSVERGGPTVCIPGRADALGVFAQRFLPRSIPRRIAGRLMRKG